MNRSEKTFYNEIEPHILRVRERNRRRGLKNTLYDVSISRKGRYTLSGSRSLIVLIKAGFGYDRACEILGK